MILFFSGTGNTRFVAESLGNLLGEDCCFIPDASAPELKFEGNRLVVCFPVYSWGIPPLVADFLKSLSDEFCAEIRSNDIPVHMVCTCGDEVAEVPEMFAALLNNKGLEVSGMWSVVMPNVYVLLPGFSVDSTEVEQKKLEAAPDRVREIADCIRRGEGGMDVVRGSWPRLKSRLIYPLFKRWGINPRRWRSSEECIHCGRCVAACPVGNMKMKSGFPHWGSHCVSCTACYQHCPTHAVSYGNFTKHKGQYFCRLHPLL